MRALEQLLFWIHGLSGAAWFGSIAYRTTIVEFKSFSFFKEIADYERFSAHMAHGMRYVVFAGLLTCGLSGFVLAGLRWNPENAIWSGLMLAKVVVWIGACGLFTYVSWVHWVWRGFAAPNELAAYRRSGIWLASAMVALAGTGFALGQACRLA